MTTASPERRIEYMALGDIPRAMRNPKAHDLGRIRGALKLYGCTVAGILDERTGRLVAGHGRLEALEVMLKEGDERPSGVLDGDGEWRAPIVRGWASANDAEAEGYVIIDNRLAEVGGWEERILAEVLDSVAEYNPDLLDMAGYSMADLDDLIASFGDVEIMEQAPSGARYAETEDEIAERRNVIENYADRRGGGSLTELILVFNGDDHSEAVNLIRLIRSRDGDQTAAQVVLNALRNFAPEQEAA